MPCEDGSESNRPGSSHACAYRFAVEFYDRHDATNRVNAHEFMGVVKRLAGDPGFVEFGIVVAHDR